MIYWSISDDALAFLVFATKYRRARFADLEAELVEFDEKHDHVHLLVNYPQKVPLSALVNSLTGVSVE
jgi:putative transposase